MTPVTSDKLKVKSKNKKYMQLQSITDHRGK